MRAPARIRTVPIALAVALVASGAARAAADPPGAGTGPSLEVAVGASAFADGTIRGTPIDLGVGVALPGRGLWWQGAVAYGPTAILDGGDGRGLELRTGPRVVRCGRRLYLCGAAGAELGWAHERRVQLDGSILRHQDLVVDARMHLLVGFDPAVTLGLDLAIGVRGRFVLAAEHAGGGSATTDFAPEATPGVVAGIAFFVRR